MSSLFRMKMSELAKQQKKTERIGSGKQNSSVSVRLSVCNKLNDDSF